MSSWREWLRQHTYAIHTLAFILMIFSAAMMFPAAQKDSQGWMIALLALFALSNGLILLVK